ncbi:uncharacterized protein [Triticum aestivum]|uniref:uncharacterized protein n=1 Tax=Triticum aestivum TaxID=4565 RepID=UPI001D029A3C|nr:uncharacterized protein LOC123166837 [Triticum aestivum]
MAPRIAAYTQDQVDMLIKLLKAKPAAYRTRPEGYIRKMELMWHPLMAGSISLDNVEEVGQVGDNDSTDIERIPETTAVAPVSMTAPTRGVPGVRHSPRLSAKEKGKKVAVEESDMESSDSNEDERARGERPSRRTVRNLRTQDNLRTEPQQGIHCGMLMHLQCGQQ